MNPNTIIQQMEKETARLEDQVARLSSLDAQPPGLLEIKHDAVPGPLFSSLLASVIHQQMTGAWKALQALAPGTRQQSAEMPDASGQVIDVDAVDVTDQTAAESEVNVAGKG
jgi:hypothetical protein